MPADTTHAHAHTCTDFTEREHKHVYGTDFTEREQKVIYFLRFKIVFKIMAHDFFVASCFVQAPRLD